jgi:hypothetical protein
MSRAQSTSQVSDLQSGPSGVGDNDNVVNVYVTLHHSGNPDEDILINAVLLESLQALTVGKQGSFCHFISVTFFNGIYSVWATFMSQFPHRYSC